LATRLEEDFGFSELEVSVAKNGAADLLRCGLALFRHRRLYASHEDSISIDELGESVSDRVAGSTNADSFHHARIAQLTYAQRPVEQLRQQQQEARTHGLWSAAIQPHISPVYRLIASTPVIHEKYMNYINDPGGMEGWADLVSWPIAESLPTVVTYQPYFGRRAGKVQRPKTDVLTTEPRRQTKITINSYCDELVF